MSGLLDHPNTMRTMALVILAVGTVAFTAATSRAAPTLLTRHGEVTDAQAQTTLNRFARFNAIRATGIAVAVLAAVWALALDIG